LLWQNGWLPAGHRGTEVSTHGPPILHLRPAAPVDPAARAADLDALAKLNEGHRDRHPHEADLEARIRNYELAARMQLAATDALEISREPVAVREMYGIGREPTDSYGRRCLIARRLVERGVRFVQLYINAQIWDTHTNLAGELRAACDRTDLPTAALIRDLKQRGLLDSTLVVWGGEFGRLPIAQLPPDKDERKAGRDHNKNAFTTWLAGGGVKAGTTHGATDELGLKAVEDRVGVPDWHATLLHLLGLRHDELYVEANGLKEKLTGVEGARVVHPVLR
jgi:hypothetical protein